MKVMQKIKKDRYYRWLIRNADNMIYYYKDVPTLDNRVNLHIYDVERSGFGHYGNEKRPHNLGDSLAIPICEFFLEKRGLRLDQPVNGKRHLFTIGSGGLNSFANGTLWGTGILFDGLRGAWWEKYWDANHRKLDIRAVRGPLSRQTFLRLGHKCPAIYGDPGILMPLIYTPKHIDQPHVAEYGIVPQHVNEPEVRKYIPDDKIISMNTNDYKKVIDKICSCKVIYTSSLHGIILAEAYGVPAVFYRGLPNIIDFKYKDYYASTGRFDVPMASTLVEAMKKTPPPLPDLRQMQQGLMDVFPFDLWN
ncbi:MAG: polysaccharide pyruvyl transferase family protein [Bacteroidales bacterium]|nr:polysaccharide pyruvyl transferase family protein [Bacteroidales bacterium]